MCPDALEVYMVLAAWHQDLTQSLMHEVVTAAMRNELQDYNHHAGMVSAAKTLTYLGTKSSI